MHIKTIIVASLLASTASFALPFQPGEQMVYSVSWKYGLVNVTAGYLTSTIPAATQDKDGNVIYAIKARIKSSGVISTVYPFEYTLATRFDQQNLFSRGFEMHGKEKSDRKDQVQVHNYAAREITFYQKTFDEKKNDEAPKIRNEKNLLDQPTQDVLSVLYYLRTAPLPEPGKELRFNAAWEGEPYTALVKNAGRDEVRFDGHKIDADVYVLDFYKDKKLDNGGTKMWVSRDARRVILKLESIVQVGKIWVKLDSIK
jgi:hypothetical protein